MGTAGGFKEDTGRLAAALRPALAARGAPQDIYVDEAAGPLRVRAHALRPELSVGMLHWHDSHNQAVARISWCIAERSIGVVTGEVGAGKTVSVRKPAWTPWTRRNTPSSTSPTR
ncbi:hypothetical protein [Streptomyces bluensis]|uniref:hypothetical protein n=1 Tax=Streptomyces bluensis TaxID=33897 RepID=UPI00332E6929